MPSALYTFCPPPGHGPCGHMQHRMSPSSLAAAPDVHAWKTPTEHSLKNPTLDQLLWHWVAQLGRLTSHHTVCTMLDASSAKCCCNRPLMPAPFQAQPQASTSTTASHPNLLRQTSLSLAPKLCLKQPRLDQLLMILPGSCSRIYVQASQLRSLHACRSTRRWIRCSWRTLASTARPLPRAAVMLQSGRWLQSARTDCTST